MRLLDQSNRGNKNDFNILTTGKLTKYAHNTSVKSGFRSSYYIL